MKEQEFKEAMTSIEGNFENALIAISRLTIPMSDPILNGYKLYPTDSKGLLVTSDDDLMRTINNHLDALRNSYNHELNKL